MEGNDAWKAFSRDYDKKVFSLTKIPERRTQILERVKPGLILNVGCGSETYLNEDLVKSGCDVIATDFCQDMLDVAASRFSHRKLKYIMADSRELPFKGCISTQSFQLIRYCHLRGTTSYRWEMRYTGYSEMTEFSLLSFRHSIAQRKHARTRVNGVL